MRPAVLALLAALLLLPAAAAAQSSPFQPLPPAPQEQPAAPAPTPGSQDDGGISSGAQALIIAAGIAFVLAIGFFIARDARRNAPGDERPGRPLEGRSITGEGERKRRDASAAQKQKAAAKRARQARKKNRPVRK